MTRLISPSVHPDVISRHTVRDLVTNETVRDDALAALVSAAAFNYETCSRVEETFSKIMRNQMASPLANEAKSRDVIFRMQEAATKKTDAAVALAVASRDNEIAKFANPAKAKNIDEATVMSDTRGALARMSAGERRKAVDAAISNGEDAVVSAVLNAPSLTSGFSKSEADAIRVKWQNSRFPLEVSRANRLDRAMNDLLRGGQALIAYCNSFTSSNRIAEAVKSEQAAISAVTKAVDTRDV